MSAAARRALLSLLFWAGCGDDPPPPAPQQAAPAAPGAPAAGAPAAGAPAAGAPAAGASAAPAGLAAPVAAPKEKLIEEIRKRPFRPEDLNANPPTNTDPFHNNLQVFVTAAPVAESRSVASILPRYSLDELKLTAIILGSGDVGTSRAMVIDPTGVGHNLKRGDRVSKTAALVQRILSDRVVFEFTEEIAPGKKRTVVRAVELHPTESQNQGGPVGGAPVGGGPVGAPPPK